MDITAAMVKAPKRETEFSLMECKHALQDSDGNFEPAKRKLQHNYEDSEEPVWVE